MNLLPHILLNSRCCEVVREEGVLARVEALHRDVKLVASLNFIFADDASVRAALHAVPVAVHRGRGVHVGLKG